MSDYAITVLLIVTLLAIAGACWLSALPKIRSRRLASLSDSQERLKVVVAELLERANDLDQHLQYTGANSGEAPLKLKSALEDLVILSETLPTIDQLIKERRVDDCNQMLSASSLLAEKVNNRLADAKRAGKTKLLSKKPDVIDVEVVE